MARFAGAGRAALYRDTRPFCRFLNKSGSAGGGGATAAVSVVPSNSAQLLLIATGSWVTSAGFTSLTVGGLTPDTVLDQTYLTTNGDMRFSSIPTERTGTGASITITYTCAANFKFRSICVWELFNLKSLTAKTATYKTETGPGSSPWTPATGITVDRHDLVFSAAFLSSAPSTSLTAANTVEAPNERSAIALNDIFTDQVIASSRSGFQIRYDYAASAAKSGAFVCVSYA